MSSARTEQHKGLTIRLELDQDCDSPLEGCCEPTITYSASSRHTLGNLAQTAEEHEETGRRIARGELIGLPVYAYVHSGVALSCGRGGQFSDPWDSGQSGYVYVAKAQALEWHGGKILTAKKRARVLASLPGTVETFAQWINGECYGFIIEDADGAEIDSCWGFVGQDYALQAARESADWHAADILKQKGETWRAALREARERKYWQARGVLTVNNAEAQQ